VRKILVTAHGEPDPTPEEYLGETDDMIAICTNIRIKTTTAATVLASAIAADLLSAAGALNSGHISTSSALVTATTRDLLNTLYEDARPSRILDDLARSHSCRWGVNDSGVFYFQPDAEGRTWYVQSDDVQIRYSLRNYENEVYAKYHDANNRTLRTAVSRDAASALSTGWVVQGVVSDQTTSSATAEAVRDAHLTDRADYALMATATFSRLRDGANRYWSLWSIRPGDRIVINNLPAQSQYLPGLDSHVVGFVEYDHENGRLSYEPEVPVPTLVTLLAERQ
jgi:hypothetical protein